MLKNLIAPLAVMSIWAAPASAQADPVNQMCPIGKERVVQSAGTVQHEGNTIGLCCPGCGEAFLAWDEERKDQFVTLAIAHREPGQNHENTKGETPSTERTSPGPTYPYTLAGCPVGGPLGSMGDPVVKVYDNREVRFCCAGCIDEFQNNKAKYWKEIDQEIIAQQLIHYPIKTCIVTDNELGDDAVNHVHNNRLVRVADDTALKAFKADPARYLQALDASIIAAQLPTYPMDRCPVGGPLGSMGEPVNFVYMNRLVRFCCAGCEKSLVTEPDKYMAKLDAAYADQQRDAYTAKTCPVSGAALGSMGDPVELLAGDRLVRFCCGSCLPKFRANPTAYLDKLPE